MIASDEHYYLGAARYFMEGCSEEFCEGFFVMPQLIPAAFFYWIPFAVFGVSSSVAFGVTLVVFYLVRFLFNETAGLWAAFFLAFEKTHIFWSGTAYDHIFSVFAFFLGLLFLFLSRDVNLWVLRLVGVLFFLYSSFIRSEFLILVPVILLFFVFFPIGLSNKKFYGFLLLELLAGSAVLNYIIKFKRGMPRFDSQVDHFLDFLISGVDWHLLFTFIYPIFLIILVLVLTPLCLKYLKKRWKEILIILSPVLFFHVFYLAFLSFLEERFLIISYILLIIYSSFLIVSLKKRFKFLYHISSLFIIIMVAVLYLTSCRDYSCYNYNVQGFLLEVEIPPLMSDSFSDCSIVTDNPEVFITEDLDVIFPEREEIELRLEEKDCVLFYRSFKSIFWYTIFGSSYDDLSKIYILTPFRVISNSPERDISFTIYKITK